MAERSCGTRADNALYLCVDVSIYGKPIEYFLVDPVKPVDLKPFRTPRIIERESHNDIAIYIGKQYYPFVPDFIGEASVMGISRRIPKSFPIERLTPYKSRMFFVHERAIPLFEYETGKECPRNISHSNKPGGTCVFDLWPLSLLEKVKGKHEVTLIDEHSAEVTTPSCTYTAPVPHKPTPNFEQKKIYKYRIGVFAAFWCGHLEYVNKEKKIPSALVKRIKETEWDVKIMEE